MTTKKQPSKKRKKEVTRMIGTRATDADIEIIDRAAAIVRRKRSPFVVLAALEEARRIIGEHGKS